MDWLVEPFGPAFMQRALWAGLLAVLVTSVVGTWVVLRGLSFVGDALAHGVIPGVALAFLAGFDLILGAVAGAVVMVAGISYVHRRARVTEDTGIGLLFVGMLALGVILISRTASYAGNLTGILFGDALGVDRGDLVLLGAGAVITLVATAVFYRPFLVLSFNEEKAEVLGLRPRLAHFAMLGLVTLAIVVSFRAVGTLLVFGLLIAPPATASLLARRVPTMMATGVALGMGSVVVGLLASFHLGTAAGATMAGTSVAAFFLVLVLKDLWGRLRPSR